MDALSPEAQARRAELPTPKSTHSYWHRDPSKKLLNHRTTEEIPSNTDVLVIGSGISGTFAARELVAGGRSVVMLEAREACWGATGRNGGHCQPGIWNTEAEIARFELATFKMIRDLVAEYKIPCDWQVVGGMHPIYTEEILEAAKKQIQRLRKYEDLKDKAQLILDKDELTARHVPEAIGAIYQPNAAKLWPYKLVAWALETLLAENDSGAFNLQTNTPVTRLEREHGHGHTWVAHTSRGKIHAREVLLTTNAYTSYLLPALTDVIVPIRGQVCALQPPEEGVQLLHSYVWTTDAGDQYLIHRGAEDTQLGNGIDRSIIIGGERLVAPEGEEGISRDDAINPSISVALHRSLVDVIKLLPAGQPERDTLRSTYEWTGIMGYSRDTQPWVGRVPSSVAVAQSSGSGGSVDVEGLWISAGFTGHGMPVAPRCGIAVAQMILGKKEDVVKLPEAWVPSDARIARARTMELLRSIEEMVLSLPVE